MSEEKFCKFCGKKIPKDSIVCPKCGSVNVLTNDTCYLCGEKLDKE